MKTKWNANVSSDLFDLAERSIDASCGHAGKTIERKSIRIYILVPDIYSGEDSSAIKKRILLQKRGKEKVIAKETQQ